MKCWSKNFICIFRGTSAKSERSTKANLGVESEQDEELSEAENDKGESDEKTLVEGETDQDKIIEESENEANTEEQNDNIEPGEAMEATENVETAETAEAVLGRQPRRRGFIWMMFVSVSTPANTPGFKP